jgi:Ca-activated chloride channel family protein
MGGVSIVQARESLSLALQQLRPGDAFNIMEFNSSFRMLYKTPVAASSHNVGRALEYVRQLEAGGGTEMLPALRAALAPRLQTDAESSNRLTQIVFITDGAVGNEQRLYKEITSSLGNKRLFTIGIGSAPNSWFMRKAAQFGRGTHTHIGDMGSGSMPLIGQVSVAGDTVGQPWSRQMQLAPRPAGVGSHPGVASLWARQKISSLLDERPTGEDASVVRREVLDVALTHALLSPYTSFVAVEEQISRPPANALKKSAVPNSGPHGQSAQNFAYPRTATTAAAKVFLGTLLLFFALITLVVRREEVDHVPLAGV